MKNDEMAYTAWYLLLLLFIYLLPIRWIWQNKDLNIDKKGRRTLNRPKDFSSRDKVNATLKKELVHEILTTGKTPLVLIELSVNEVRDLKPCLVCLTSLMYEL